jgi:hypothetical protein
MVMALYMPDINIVNQLNIAAQVAVAVNAAASNELAQVNVWALIKK